MTKTNAKDMTVSYNNLIKAKNELKAAKIRATLDAKIKRNATRGKTKIQYVIWCAEPVWELVERGLSADGFDTAITNTNVCTIKW